MPTDHRVFDHKFNAGSNWSKLAENDPVIQAWLEKEKKVWKLFATTNTATATNAVTTINTVTTANTATTINNTDSDTVTCTCMYVTVDTTTKK